MRKVAGVQEAFLSGEYIHVFVENGFDKTELHSIRDVEDVCDIKPDIEDVFIKIMSHEQ